MTPLERERVLVVQVQVLARQQYVQGVVDDVAGAASLYGALRGLDIDRIPVGVANRQRYLPCYGPCPSGSSEAASSPCSQDDTAHRLGRLVQHEGLRRLLLDEHVEALGSLVVAAELRWRRVYARLLLLIGCTHAPITHQGHLLTS